jgi:hypothetical protein
MAQTQNQQLNLRITTDLINSIDDWRRVQPKIVSMSEAIRILIGKGLGQVEVLPVVHNRHTDRK